MKKAGTTWWGQRWIEALEHVLRGDAGRLARGRTYARAGRTHDLVVEGGTVTAKVTGSRAAPYRITIDLAQLGEAAWKQAIDGMAAQGAVLGRAARGADAEGHRRGLPMPRARACSPRSAPSCTTSCSCPDWGDPCKHVAATHYVLGEALDRDPFLLFELRGKAKAHVLEALRAARGATGAPTASKRKARAEREPEGHEVPTVKLGKLDAAAYDRPREALPSLRFGFDEPVMHGAVLRQLGAPAAWEGDASPADVLAPLVRAAAQIARRIAMAEPSEPGDRPAVPPTRKPAPIRARAPRKST